MLKKHKSLRLTKWGVCSPVFLLTAFVFTGEARAEIINLSIIKNIESNGNPNVISKTGAIGLYQIMPCVLVEYNHYNASNFNKEALFSPKVNESVARWYLTKRIPSLLKFYHKPITLENIIWAYNAGIGNVVKNRLPKETKNYIAKYKRLERSIK